MAYLVQGISMPTVINLTDQDIYEDIKQYLESFCPCPVLQGYPENSPPPSGDFVYMNILFSKNMALDTFNSYDKDLDESYVHEFRQTTIQLDFYGPSSEKLASTFEILWKNHHACEGLKVCQPLYVVSCIRSVIANETQSYEDRWIVTATLQYNPTVTHDQEFINQIPINISHVKGS